MDSVSKTRQTRQTRQMAELAAPKTRQTRQHPIGVSGLSGGVSGDRGDADLSDCRPTNNKNPLVGSQAGLRPVAPVGAGVDQQTAALLAAGRLLQSRGWPVGKKTIERQPGESYPEAVSRVIAGLPTGERDRLRELVGWVRSYEREG